jgi:hypothetical protein
VLFTLTAIVGASIHLALSPRRRSSGAAIASTYLVYLFFFYVGLMGLLTAYAHVFRPVETSASIGWLTSPYEYEVGMADLTVGVLGALCLKYSWRLLVGDGNCKRSLVAGRRGRAYSADDAEQQSRLHQPGIFLVTEIIMPLVILFLTLHYRRREGKVTL